MKQWKQSIGLMGIALTMTVMPVLADIPGRDVNVSVTAWQTSPKVTKDLAAEKIIGASDTVLVNRDEINNYRVNIPGYPLIVWGKNADVASYYAMTQVGDNRFFWQIDSENTEPSSVFDAKSGRALFQGQYYDSMTDHDVNKAVAQVIRPRAKMVKAGKLVKPDTYSPTWDFELSALKNIKAYSGNFTFKADPHRTYHMGTYVKTVNPNDRGLKFLANTILPSARVASTALSQANSVKVGDATFYVPKNIPQITSSTGKEVAAQQNAGVKAETVIYGTRGGLMMVLDAVTPTHRAERSDTQLLADMIGLQAKAVFEVAHKDGRLVNSQVVYNNGVPMFFAEAVDDKQHARSFAFFGTDGDTTYRVVTVALDDYFTMPTAVSLEELRDILQTVDITAKKPIIKQFGIATMAVHMMEEIKAKTIKK